jgi:hypothetical protein
MDRCYFAFTVKADLPLSLRQVGSIKSSPLYTLDGTPGLTEFIRQLETHVPAEAQEILVYKRAGSPVSWEQCSRLVMAWSMVKLPKNLHQNAKSTKENYTRHGIYSVNEVLDQVVFPEKSPLSKRGHRKRSLREYGRALVKMDGLRYRTFATKGVVCVTCGLVGEYFALESHRKNPKKGSQSHGMHLNLYGIDARGEEVLFSKDHIHPKSRGGSDTLPNLDTMCVICNGKKGDSVPWRPVGL